jgi:hypothetical protein
MRSEPFRESRLAGRALSHRMSLAVGRRWISRPEEPVGARARDLRRLAGSVCDNRAVTDHPLRAATSGTVAAAASVLRVREMQLAEVGIRIDYFQNASDDHLRSLGLPVSASTSVVAAKLRRHRTLNICARRATTWDGQPSAILPFGVHLRAPARGLWRERSGPPPTGRSGAMCRVDTPGILDYT